jgi:hypothetical protein
MVRLFHKCNHLECVREHYVHSIQSLQISISSTADRRCGAALMLSPIISQRLPAYSMSG